MGGGEGGKLGVRQIITLQGFCRVGMVNVDVRAREKCADSVGKRRLRGTGKGGDFDRSM